MMSLLSSSAGAVKRRPSEFSAAGGGVTLLIAHLLGVVDDPDTVAVIGAAVGLIPAAVTALVNAGGVRGALRLLWRGRGPQ